MRTPLAPAASNCSTTCGSRDAGPRVIKILALLKVSTDLGCCSFQSAFDSFVNSGAGRWTKADQTIDKLALAIEDERLRNSVAVGKQEGYQFFVRYCEWVMNAELSGETGNSIFVTWTTDVEADDLESLGFILFLQTDQVRNTLATGIAPRRIKVEQEHLAFVLRKQFLFSI